MMHEFTASPEFVSCAGCGAELDIGALNRNPRTLCLHCYHELRAMKKQGRYLENPLFRKQIVQRNKLWALRQRTGGSGVKRSQWQDRLEEFNNCCAYCLKPLGSNAAVDHIVPVSKGGTSYIDNLVPACKSCNSSKGSKSLLQFVGGI